MKTAVIDGFLGLAAMTLVACGTPEKTAILRTMAEAGRERRANLPASSRERVGHVLTCNVMGRSGMGVGFHAARR